MVVGNRQRTVDGADPTARAIVADPAAQDLAAAALVTSLLSDPWGQISPSVYETGRLVTLAEWLPGHRERVDFLLAGQRPDGAWAAGDEYGLVPTLSATEALLSAVPVHGPTVVDAARRGLDRLCDWLTGPDGYRAPDTPAIELIVPALVEAVNQRLAGFADQPVDGLGRWSAGIRLPAPAGMGGAALAALRSRLATGSGVPTKVLHSLEVAGLAAGGVDTVRPAPPGTVGGSPAATAAWLTGNPTDRAAAASARQYLRAVAGRYGGPVPSVVPIAPFERAWVLNLLLDGGFRPTPADDLVTMLAAPLGADGMSGGAGLPPDADTTSATLRALVRLGAPVDLDCLRGFETDSHFCTWHGERTPSTTTNAHVLDAFGECASRRDGRPADRLVVDKISGWLCDQQLSDGTWTDKWHASPYYATLSCVLALHRFGRPVGPAGRPAVAVRHALRWMVGTQRPDGSWGRWSGTVEETAYAVQALLLTRVPGVRADDPVSRAVARGLAYLATSFGNQSDPPLWHDKDLYAPAAIIRAAVLAALRLGRDRPASPDALANHSTAVV